MNIWFSSNKEGNKTVYISKTINIFKYLWE